MTRTLYRQTLVVGVVVFIVALAILIIGIRGGGSEANPQFPPEGEEEAGTEHTHDLPPLEFWQKEAVGFSTTASKLNEDLDDVSFVPLVPGYLPSDLALERYNLKVFGDEATLDLSYTVPVDENVAVRPTVHIWQSNVAYEIPAKPAQAIGDSDTLLINGQSWYYWLLGYRQPDGRVLEVYDAEATHSDGVSVTVDIWVGLDPKPADRAATLRELQKVIESLTPTR